MDWPDWSDGPVAILASGPSLKRNEVALLKGRLRTFAIKRNIEIAPWAEAVYGCDRAWWTSVAGLPDFRGLKLAYAPLACTEFGCRRVEIDIWSDRLSTVQVGKVGSGGNSGFQALNLAIQFGAPRVLLIGFDCHDRGGAHWYGRNSAPGMTNPDEANFKRWRTAFQAAALQASAIGVDVVNASASSALKGFRHQSIAETLQEWGV